jgi:predicted component of type VI protein secretion system
LNEREKKIVSWTFSFLKITQLRKFAKEDLITWLSEPVIYGDPVMTSAEASEVEPIEPPMTLFTSAGSALAATTMTRFGTPSIVHRGNERLTTPSNYNRTRPPINLPPRPAFNTTPRPPISTTPRPSIRPSLNPIAQPIRPPSGSQFSFKSPSAVVSTPRPAPYHQPNRSSRVLNASPSIATGSGNKSENADENFLSQFLQGVDTDSLFDDF